MWWSWLPAAGIAGLAVWLACLVEEEMWGEINGYISVLLTGALAAMVLMFGHNRYLVKEGVSRPGRSGSGGGFRWIWIIVAVLIVLFTMARVYNVTDSDSSYDRSPTTLSPPHSHMSHDPADPSVSAAGLDGASPQEASKILERRSRAQDEAMAQADRMRARHAERQVSTGVVMVGPIFLILGVVVVFLLIRKRTFKPGRLRGPRRRHIVTRSVCAVLAVAILASIGYFSWTEAVAVYPTESLEPGSLHVPTKKPSVLTAELKPHRQMQLSEARLLIKAVVLEEVTPGSFRALRVEEFDIAWRGSSNVMLNNSFKLGTSVLRYSLSIANVYMHRDSESSEAGVHLNGNWRMEVRNLYGNRRSSSSGGGIIRNGIGGIHNIKAYNQYGNNKPLSVVSSSSDHGQLTLCLFADIADDDDKLAAIPAQQFIADRHEQILASVSRSGSGGGHNRRWVVDSDAPPIFPLIEHIGIAGLLLALAAVLLGQLFMRRGLATVAMLTTVILYVAAIDRIALGMHMSHAQDTDASLSERLAACGAASNTFFFANTASSQLRSIASDKQTPDSLKYRAGRNARLLTAIADPRTGPTVYSRISSSSTTIRLPVDGKNNREAQRWEISTFSRWSDERPVAVVVRIPPRGTDADRLDDHRILWRVISSQVDPAGRID